MQWFICVAIVGHKLNKAGIIMNQTKLTFRVFNGVDKRLKDALNQNFIKRDAFVEHLINVELPNLSEALQGVKNSDKARAFINVSMEKKRRTTTMTVVVEKTIANRLRKITEDHNLSRDAFINRLLIFVLLNEKQLEAIGVKREAAQVESEIGYVEGIPTSPMEAFSYWMNDPMFLIRESLRLSGENMYLMDLDCLMAELTFRTACYLPDDHLPDPEFEELCKSILLDDFLPEA